MLEVVLALGMGGQLADQVGALGLDQIVVEATGRLGDSLQDVAAEAAADHRGDLEGRPGRAEAVDPGDDQRLERAGQLDGVEVADELPAVVAARPGCRARRGCAPAPRARAACRPRAPGGRGGPAAARRAVRRRRRLAGRRPPEQAGGKLGAGGLGERPERDLDVPLAEAPLAALAESLAGGVRLRAEGAAEQQPGSFGPVQQLQQQVDGGRIGPVEVVKLQDERLAGGDAIHEGDDGIEEAALEVARRERIERGALIMPTVGAPSPTAPAPLPEERGWVGEAEQAGERRLASARSSAVSVARSPAPAAGSRCSAPMPASARTRERASP